MKLWHRIVGTPEFREAWKAEYKALRSRWVGFLASISFFVGIAGLILFGLMEETRYSVAGTEKQVLYSALLFMFAGGLSLSLLNMAFVLRVMWRVKNKVHGRPGFFGRLTRGYVFLYLLAMGLAGPVVFGLSFVPEERSPPWLTDWFEADDA